MKELSTNRRFWLFWVLAFLSFPVAGVEQADGIGNEEKLAIARSVPQVAE